MRSEAKDHIYGCITFKGCLGGKNYHSFEDLETSSYGLVTISKLLFLFCINIDTVSYTHCECTGPLAKFCYDRINNLNFVNKSVWFKKGANPLRLKNV